MNTILNREVKKYILDRISPENYDEDPQTDAEKLLFLDKTFRSEAEWNIARVGYQAAMTEWLQGLPSAFDIDFMNHEIIALAIEWTSIPSDATERQQDKILANWWDFIAAKITMMVRKTQQNKDK